MKGLPELVIGDLKVKRPVIQGGMGVGVSLGQLAGAVAKEGGVGIISTAQIGFREPDFETNTRAANIRAIGSEFQRARETAPDGVIEGPKAGGHLGFDREQLETYTQESYDNEIERIMAVVRKYAQKYQVHIPVAVAGGISDKDAAEHAFSLGADAVQAATRFVTTWECDADLSYKQSYLNAKKEDVILVKSPVGMPGRAIKNPFISHVMAGERVKPKRCLGCLKNCNPAEVPYCITEALIKAAKGEIGEALLFCGADVWKAEKIETVKEVIDSLLGDCV